MTDVLERLKRRSVVDEETGCWVWQGATAGKGYAHLRVDGQDRYGHRLAFEVKHGRPPADGLVVDHIVCDNKPCVNPDHVMETTNAINVGRSLHSSDTCRKGHPVDRVTPKGKRYCSTCSHASNQRRAVRRREG